MVSSFRDGKPGNREMGHLAMRILLVGYGRMGKLVGGLAGQYDCEVAGIVHPQSPASSGPIDHERLRGIDMAVDFSFPEAVPVNLPVRARLGLNIVVGTTGWASHEAALREAVAGSGARGVAAPNV